MQSLRNFFLIALVILPVLVKAQPFKNSISQVMLTQWTGNEGLISNNLTSSIQTQSGFIWITTYNGIMRFDGVKYDVYNRQLSPSLKSDAFYKVYEDSKGTLWFASQGSGIVKYQNNIFEQFLEKNSILPKSIRCLYLENDETIWAGSFNRGLYKIQNGEVQSIADSVLKDITVLDIIKDTDGALWIATEGYGVIKLTSNSVREFTTFEGLQSNIVNTIIQLPTGEIAVGTNNGLNLITDDEVTSFNDLIDTRINSMLTDADGTLWIGAENGLGRLSKDKLHFEFSNVEQAPFSRINDLTLDHEGSLWICTGRSGLMRLRDTPITPITTAQGLATNLSNCIAHGKHDELYFGSDLGHLDHYEDGKISSVPIKTPLNQESIRDIYVEDEKTIWLATYKGVIKIEDKKETLITDKNGLPSNDVRRIFRDSNGNLWLATRSSGAVKYSTELPIEILDRQNGLSSNYILAIEEDTHGRIYFGTHSGGLSILEKDGTLNTYHFPTTDDGFIIFNIHFDSSGNTWLATNNGLYLFKNKRLREINIHKNTHGNTYFDCFNDNQGNLWLTANTGVIRIASEEVTRCVKGLREYVTARTFNEEDGMLNKECTSAARVLTNHDGKIYIPTIHGISIIDPQQISDKDEIPKVLITELQTDNNRFALDSAVVLQPGNLRYTFLFTSPVFTSPSQVQFKYKLEGIDRFWVNATSNRRVEYTNLPPGTYTFRVIAAIGDGPWSTQTSSPTITIEPYFYQTLWFKAVFTVFILIILFGFYKWRVHFIVKRNAELVKVNKELDRFVYSASHDLRAPLTSILGLISLARLDKETPTDNYLKRIEVSIHKMDAFIRDIIDFSRNARVEIVPELIHFQKLIDDTIDNLKYLNEGNQIKPTITINGTEPFYTDPKRLAIILNNLISNSFKYYNPEEMKPYIIIQVHHSKTQCIITIRDNGIGIPEGHLNHIFKMFYRAHEESKGSGLGLYIVKETIDKLNGKMQVQSAVGKGTAFEIKLPNLKKVRTL